MHWRANHDDETTDWRAVCERTARMVRRAERAKALLDPYSAEPRQTGNPTNVDLTSQPS